MILWERNPRAAEKSQERESEPEFQLREQSEVEPGRFQQRARRQSPSSSS